MSTKKSDTKAKEIERYKSMNYPYDDPDVCRITPATITKLTVTARPPRIAYLVPKNSPSRVLEAVSYCTCQWGGMQNHIVPLPKSRKALLEVFQNTGADFAVNLADKAKAPELAPYCPTTIDRTIWRRTWKHRIPTMLSVYQHIHMSELRFVTDSDAIKLQQINLKQGQEDFWFKVAHHGFFDDRAAEHMNAFRLLSRKDNKDNSTVNIAQIFASPDVYPLKLTNAKLNTRHWSFSKQAIVIGSLNSKLSHFLRV